MIIDLQIIFIFLSIHCFLQTGNLLAQGSWTQKANFGGTGRYSADGFSLDAKGYIGTGFNGAAFQDFWEWDQATNVWTQKSNFPGAARFTSSGFSIGTKGYIGMGCNGAVTVAYNNFYE